MSEQQRYRQRHPARSTTGHEWDGIKELNTPLPRWWVLTFYATIFGRLAYWIVYPAWPLVSGYTTGVLHYSQPRRRCRRSRRSREDTRRQDEGTCRAPLLPISRRIRHCLRWRARAARRCSATIARRATARRRRRQGLSEPERRRLAVGRFARADHADDPVRGAVGQSEGP